MSNLVASGPSRRTWLISVKLKTGTSHTSSPRLPGQAPAFVIDSPSGLLEILKENVW